MVAEHLDEIVSTLCVINDGSNNYGAKLPCKCGKTQEHAPFHGGRATLGCIAGERTLPFCAECGPKSVAEVKTSAIDSLKSRIEARRKARASSAS